ncbi:cysteine desulfurase CsdA, partial [Pseudomonas aeruginosa]
MSLPSPWRADFPAFSAFAAEGLTYLDSAAEVLAVQDVDYGQWRLGGGGAGDVG